MTVHPLDITAVIVYLLLILSLVIPGLLMIGVGLFAYFTGHPAELGEGTLAEILAWQPDISDRALPEFVRLHFPPGLAGLFLAPLMAAIMSSVASGIHSVTTALVVDFRDRLFPWLRPKDDRSELRSIRLMVLVIGAIAITLACFVGPLGDVFDAGGLKGSMQHFSEKEKWMEEQRKIPLGGGQQNQTA